MRDERGYDHHAVGIHGLPLPIYCTHGDHLFLPWHRAYLYFFELALRDHVPTVSLPWWDWSSEQAHASGIPEAYAAESVNGEIDPLYSVRMNGHTGEIGQSCLSLLRDAAEQVTR